MRRPARALVVLPVLVLLAALSFEAAEALRSDVLVRESAVEMDTWAASGAQPRPDTWRSVNERLESAARLQPEDPSIQELLGILAARRADSPELMARGVVHLTRALEARPVSPYAWAVLAETRYKLGDTGSAFQVGLQRAVELGRNEPGVQRSVSLYGLAVWDEVDEPTRVAIEKSVSAGVRRDPAEMMQIGGRRGRLGVVCRHLAESPRQVDPKWLQRCKTTEAS